MPYELQLRTFYVAPTLPSIKTPPQPNARKQEQAEEEARKRGSANKTRVVMKADKGNCFVVMDKKEYNEKMQALLQTHSPTTK